MYQLIIGLKILFCSSLCRCARNHPIQTWLTTRWPSAGIINTQVLMTMTSSPNDQAMSKRWEQKASWKTTAAVSPSRAPALIRMKITAAASSSRTPALIRMKMTAAASSSRTPALIRMKMTAAASSSRTPALIRMERTAAASPSRAPALIRMVTTAASPLALARQGGGLRRGLVQLFVKQNCLTQRLSYCVPEALLLVEYSIVYRFRV
jgi:hypothetical protein